MAILTMDTATDALAVAVGDIERVRASMAVAVPRAHSRLLQPSIQNVLTAAGVSAKDLTEIGVGVGPGSYTGVRMAVSTAKAMADTLQIPLVPIPTLLGLAEAVVPGSISDCVVMPLLFARRQRAYGAIYQKHGNRWTALTEIVAQPVTEWITQLQHHLSTRSTGSASIVHDFQESHGVLPLLADVTEKFPVAQFHLLDAVGGLGPALIRLVSSGVYPSFTGNAVDTVLPEYALEVQAEVKLRENGGESLVTGV